nr:phosphatase PAP2 family protein [uncultured Flavobacterium sp.]
MAHRLRLYVTAVLMLFVLAPLCAQEPVTDTVSVTLQPADTLAALNPAPEEGTIGHRFAYDMGSIYRGVLFTYSRPAHWQKDDFITAGAFLGSSAFLTLADESMADYFSKQGKKVPEGWHKAGWYMGKPQYNYTFTLGFYAAGLITKNQKIRRAGVVMITAATTGGLLQTVFKQVAGRARPSAGVSHMSFKPFSKEEAYHSFPSGHTILSTTVFYSLSKQFSNPWVKAGFYTAGLLTPASRMWDNAHWISDVFVGAGIGIICVESAERFLKLNERYAADRAAGVKEKKISWNIRAGYNQIGITGTF